MESIDAVTETPAQVPQFTVRLSATGRGARLARRLAVQQLAAWEVPYDSEVSHTVAVVTAELAANAVAHGRLPGRGFRLSLLRLHGHVRVEVTDVRPEHLPPTAPAAEARSLDADSGRGLLLVSAYAERWGCEVRDTCTKTVWAEIACPQ
ncbi:ATP-binding protein [Streptomyces sp. NEAU-W12]|uniref:ATP-binding protein n=1 Tax=Streptomyces sp. NEAU-W12 TaxID=2994668 RepID=UPI00224B1807|nr:ATP-binding protein [Streptomyces sp. NEAU-W12]MCX2926130.1 ATP-binding protein [Streptomyces sp. NEAU-W12]